jgi:hypothetical protein
MGGPRRPGHLRAAHIRSCHVPPWRRRTVRALSRKAARARRLPSHAEFDSRRDCRVPRHSSIVLIAAAKTAVSLRLRRQPDFPFEILASSALTTSTVIGVAANALTSAAAPSPRIESSIEAVLNFEDATPQNLGTGGTPASGSVKSLFQTDAIALRLIWPMTCGTLGRLSCFGVHRDPPQISAPCAGFRRGSRAGSARGKRYLIIGIKYLH